MSIYKKSFFALLLAATQATMPALAQTTVSGVKYEADYTLGGEKLQLNGAGTRIKAIFKVYTAGLYLGKKASTPEEVLAAPGNKRLDITILRDIDSGELVKLFSRGLEDNMEKKEFSKVIPSLLRMSQMFSDYKNMKPGDTFSIDWLPGTGTIFTIKGKRFGEPFKEPEFFNAMMRIWLGPNPADWKLKDALLGKAS
jgi:Chalcone isomerase-like